MDNEEDMRKKLFMPCLWDAQADELEDGDTIQINTFHWTFVSSADGNWSEPLLHKADLPNPSDCFVVIRVNGDTNTANGRPQTRSLWKGLGKLVLGTTSPAAAPVSAENEPVYIALKAPNGMLLAANADATVSARVDPGGDEPADVPLEVVFRVEKHSDIGVAFWSMSNSRYLRAWSDGTLRLHMAEVTSWEQFHMRQLKMVPKFLGTNLGGWLVTENWMSPVWLYEGVYKDLLDGTSVKLQSLSEGKWASAEGGGGDQIHANRDSPSSWETFCLRRTSEGGLQIRAGSGHYWRPERENGEIVAESEEGGSKETFWLRRKVGDDTLIQLKASNGKWVRVDVGGTLYADVIDDAPGWGTNCTFTLKVEANMGGEFQLEAGLGPEEAAKRLARHREEWITEKDFEWLAKTGANAVRIPVGYWAASDPNPPAPFVSGSLNYLDKAFEWAEKHDIRVLVCLHAAPGSQNGWEHSASRDGIPMWGKKGTPFVQQSVEVIQFLVTRYGDHPNFAGLEPINEPRADSISFEDLSQYYLDCYRILRRASPEAYFIIESRIFSTEKEWENFMTGPEYTNVIFDIHWYQVHDANEFGNKTVEFNLEYPVVQREKQLRQIERGRRLVFVGEWSLGLNCENSDEITTKFAKAQVERYVSSSAGFFFWSLKHGQGWDPWSFEKSVEKKWMDPEWWGASYLLKLKQEEAEEEDGRREEL